MVPAEFSFDTDVLPVVREYAAVKFAGHSDQHTMIGDAISSAWETYRSRPTAPPKSIAFYAVRRVKVGRQFRQSERSITGPNPHRRAKALRDSAFDVGSIFGFGDDPADLAALRVDYPEWYASLKERQRAALEAFLTGDTTSELAERFGCSRVRVSQLRRELVDSWLLFTA